MSILTPALGYAARAMRAVRAHDRKVEVVADRGIDAHVRPEEWKEELASQKQFFEKLGSKFPKELWDEHNALKDRLGVG